MAKKQPKFMKKAPLRRKEPGVAYAIPFFAVLAVLTVVSFIIPLRPTVSYIEKRTLAEFPEFSVEALASALSPETKIAVCSDLGYDTESVSVGTAEHPPKPASRLFCVVCGY